jgi:hypothetical protein
MVNSRNRKYWRTLMDRNEAIETFKSKFTMYKRADLEAQLTGVVWNIFLVGSTTRIGYVTSDGIAHLGQ